MPDRVAAFQRQAFGETIVDGNAPAVSEKTNSLLIRETTVAAVMQSGARVVFSALPASVAARIGAGAAPRRIVYLYQRQFAPHGRRRAAAHSGSEPRAPGAGKKPAPGISRLHRRQPQLRGGRAGAGPEAAHGLRHEQRDRHHLSSRLRRRPPRRRRLGHPGKRHSLHRRRRRKNSGRNREDPGCPGPGQGSGATTWRFTPPAAAFPSEQGHLQSVSVEFRQAASGQALAASLAAFGSEAQRLDLPTAPRRPLLVHEKADRPQPRLDVDAGEPERARGMAVSVGRLRVRGKRCDFFLLVNNTVRGAAGGSRPERRIGLQPRSAAGGTT